jgi:threonine dehydratase
VRITLSDKPGALGDVLAVVGQARANVVSVQMERAGRDVAIGSAEVTLNLETQNMEHTKSLLSELDKARMKYRRLS